VFLLQTWSPNLDFVFQVNAPSWSVSVELFFYACFPLLMVAARKVLRSTRSSVIAFFACSAALIAIAAYFQQRGWAAYPPDDPASAFRWIYRSPLFRLIDFMLGIKLNAYWKITWAYIIPAVLVFIFCYAMATYTPLKEGDYVYPAVATGMLVTVSPSEGGNLSKLS
jgi:peptidoglycan/LPS O-acetylase OafA/YrhL